MKLSYEEWYKHLSDNKYCSDGYIIYFTKKSFGENTKVTVHPPRPCTLHWSDGSTSTHLFSDRIIEIG